MNIENFKHLRMILFRHTNVNYFKVILRANHLNVIMKQLECESLQFHHSSMVCQIQSIRCEQCGENSLDFCNSV